MLFAHFTGDTNVNSEKAMVAKTADVIMKKAVTPSCTRGHFNSVSLKNVFDKGGEIIDFINSQPLSTCLFNIPCNEMVSMH